MREIIKELEILYEKMNNTNKELENEMGNKNLPFAKLLYTVTKGVSKDDLFNMTNEELIRLIQKIQIIEG